jgi:hypothetical protein
LRASLWEAQAEAGPLMTMMMRRADMAGVVANFTISRNAV